MTEILCKNTQHLQPSTKTKTGYNSSLSLLLEVSQNSGFLDYFILIFSQILSISGTSSLRCLYYHSTNLLFTIPIHRIYILQHRTFCPAASTPAYWFLSWKSRILILRTEKDPQVTSDFVCTLIRMCLTMTNDGIDR